MSIKRKARGVAPATAEPSGLSSGSPTYLVVVQRGRTGVYETLKERLEEPELVEVIWDRRVEERRRAMHAISADRRREPPVTWTTLGFVLVLRSRPESHRRLEDHRWA